MKPDLFLDGPLRMAVRRLFNADLAGSQAVLRAYLAKSPQDPLGYGLAAAVPFYHFAGSRLRTEGGGGVTDMILGKGIGVPPDLEEIAGALDQARRLAEIDLDTDPRDQNALLALCIVEGVERDILVLLYKRWMASLKHAQAASVQAHRLLEVNEDAYDAYYILGVSEYAMARVPALVRPFAKIPGIVGQKSRAIQYLEAAGRGGWYLRDFARQMLVTIHREEGRSGEAARVMQGMVEDFAGNDAYRTELERLKV